MIHPYRQGALLRNLELELERQDVLTCPERVKTSQLLPVADDQRADLKWTHAGMTETRTNPSGKAVSWIRAPLNPPLQVVFEGVQTQGHVVDQICLRQRPCFVFV